MSFYTNPKIATEASLTVSPFATAAVDLSAYPDTLETGQQRDVWTAKRPALVTRGFFQLGGGLLFAMIRPMAFKADSYMPPVATNVVYTALGIFLAIAAGYYTLRRMSDFPAMKEVGSVIPVFTFSFLAVIGWFFFIRLEYSRFQFISSYLLSIVWFVGVFVMTQRVARRTFAVVPIGAASSICQIGQADWRIIGYGEPLPPHCSAVIADLRADLPAEWEQFITTCALNGTPVYHYKHIRELLTGQLEIEHLSENILSAHNPHDGYLKFKRIADTSVAFVAAIVLSPVLLCVALAIRLDSKGPALFKQARIGRGGAVFTIYKFRTMFAAGDLRNAVDASITQHNDQRITRLGTFLRRSRIDELPQIINILKGEMSWIGPRPEAIALTQWYQGQLPFYHYRHIVPPGITGWAQVNQGHVTDPSDVLSKLHYDFFYIKNFSIWLDMLIVLKTARTMLTGFGAR